MLITQTNLFYGLIQQTLDFDNWLRCIYKLSSMYISEQLTEKSERPNKCFYTKYSFSSFSYINFLPSSPFYLFCNDCNIFYRRYRSSRTIYPNNYSICVTAACPKKNKQQRKKERKEWMNVCMDKDTKEKCWNDIPRTIT